MAGMYLQELKDICRHLLGKKAHAMQDLEVSLRAKGQLTREEDITLRACMAVANVSATVVLAGFSLVGFFVAGQALKFAGVPPTRLFRFGVSTGISLPIGKAMHYASLHGCTLYVLDNQEEHCERMKMELASIILNEHSEEKSLVEAVKRHFCGDHLYSDQHQDRPLFRWRQRHSYVDSTYMERMKEIEASISEEGKTICGPMLRSFGDIMEDPLACMLGSPDCKMESDKPPENAPTILRRRDLRNQKRSRRRHHQHATL